jgi:hypothetical protein
MALTPEDVAQQEQVAAAIVGQRLNGVTYISLSAGRPESTWESVRAHSVDFGVDLHFGGHAFSVGWVPPTEDYEGLRVAQAQLLHWRDVKAISTEVGNSAPWSQIVGDPLSAVRLDWRTWSPSSSALYLVGVHLIFEDQRAITLALADDEHGEIVRSATNVTVLFGDAQVP